MSGPGEYADQRAHDVAWMTAAERAALDAPEVCGKCGHPVMRSWGGYGHAPGYRGRRHVVTVEPGGRP